MYAHGREGESQGERGGRDELKPNRETGAKIVVVPNERNKIAPASD